MTVKSDKLTCIDLFAGAGGLSEGLEQAGFHSLFASEIVERYAETYSRNHPNAEVCVADIRTVDPSEVRKKPKRHSETSLESAISIKTRGNSADTAWYVAIQSTIATHEKLN